MNSSGLPAPAEPAPRVVNQSYRETGQIVSAGASLEDAAAVRSLSVGTILGHLERLVEERVAVEWSHLLPSTQRRAEIEAAFEVVGDNPLRPVWEELEGRYAYEEIRLVRLARRNAGKADPSAPSVADGPDPRSMLRHSGYRTGGNG